MVLYIISFSGFARTPVSNILILGNRCFLQQQYVDCKIVDVHVVAQGRPQGLVHMVITLSCPPS